MRLFSRYTWLQFYPIANSSGRSTRQEVLLTPYFFVQLKYYVQTDAFISSPRVVAGAMGPYLLSFLLKRQAADFPERFPISCNTFPGGCHNFNQGFV
jgi:hypothetical protein